MNREALEHLLAPAAAQIPETYGLAHVSSQLNNADYLAAHRQLSDVLSAEPDMAEFEGCAFLDLGCVDVSHDTVAHWLAWRTARVGPAQALDNLETFLSADVFDYTLQFAVAGRDLSKVTFSLTEDVEIVPLEQLDPMFDAARQPGLVSLLHQPGAGVVIRRRPSKRYFAKGGPSPAEWPEFLDADDVVNCLALLGPPPPVIVGVVCNLDPSVPLMGFLQFPTFERRMEREPLYLEDLHRVRDIYQEFHRVPEDKKKRLRVPMRRLHAAMRRRDFADAAIDLAVALESIFLPPKFGAGEHKYKVGVHAARFLANEVDERKRYQELAGDVYQLRNRATHRGRITDSDLSGDKTIRNVLADGYEMVSIAVEKLIRFGEPDWDDVVLGK